MTNDQWEPRVVIPQADEIVMTLVSVRARKAHQIAVQSNLGITLLPRIVSATLLPHPLKVSREPQGELRRCRRSREEQHTDAFFILEEEGIERHLPLQKLSSYFLSSISVFMVTHKSGNLRGRNRSQADNFTCPEVLQVLLCSLPGIGGDCLVEARRFIESVQVAENASDDPDDLLDKSRPPHLLKYGS